MFVRLYTGDDGHTHFEDLDPEHLEKTQSVTFGEYPANHLINWHVAPEPIYYINLSGEFEYETNDGSIRRFGPGDVILVEDVSGTGHISRTLSKERTFAVIRQNSSDGDLG